MSKFLFYNLVLLTAFAGLLSELLQTHILTLTWGGLITQITLVFAIYIFSMGVGAAFAPQKGNSSNQFTFLQFTLSALGLASPFLLLYINYHFSQSMSIILSYTTVTIIGFASGFELPLLYRMKNQTSETFERLMSIDYLGMALGSFFFSAIFLQVFGFWKSVFLNSFLNCLIGLTTLFFFSRNQRPIIKVFGYFCGLILASICGVGIYFENSILNLTREWIIR